MCLGLDDFKEINEKQGSDYGDMESPVIIRILEGLLLMYNNV